MRRIPITPRSDWQATAAAQGFDFHTLNGTPYWDERAYYAFTLAQVERDIEDPTVELHHMALDLAGDIVRSDELMDRVGIPSDFRDYVAQSWNRGEPHLYGRMDLAYDGAGPAKLYELQYDSAASLFESAAFQLTWFDQQLARGALPEGCDQFNTLREKLVMAFATIAKALPRPLYFSALRDSIEDNVTVNYLRDCAGQAGVDGTLIAMEDIGLSADGKFTDLNDNVMAALVKLYPFDAMFGDTYGASVAASGLQLVEPAWKAMLSSKAVLALLWERHEGHPNLLPTYLDELTEAPRAGWVHKPLYGRQGAGIEICSADGTRTNSSWSAGPGRGVRQAYHPLPCFDGNYPLVGSWVVADNAAGMGIRDDVSLITQDTARFVPHIFTA